MIRIKLKRHNFIKTYPSRWSKIIDRSIITFVIVLFILILLSIMSRHGG
jgi:hypothetical protein